MRPDPNRLAYAESSRGPMADAIKRFDLRKINEIVNGVPKLRFVPGGFYALCVFGAPPAPPREGVVERADQALGKLMGVDAVDTIEQSAVITLRGTYKGRSPDMLRPHVFRAPNGQDIVLGDMDILAWEKA